MKHLKPYKLFESKILNPVLEYLLPLYDLGFEESKDLDILGLVELSLKIKNPTDDFLSEVFGEYLSLIDRLKSDDFKITSHGINFSESDIKITFKRKITDILQEIEMNTDQKIAYDAILKCLNEGESLIPDHISSNFISLELYWRQSYTRFVDICGNGKVDLPILRGYKSQRRTELPFTDEDINWFKRIIWMDKGNRFMENKEEFDTLHRKTQQELREIYN